jgi:hypothetical protein
MARPPSRETSSAQSPQPPQGGVSAPLTVQVGYPLDVEALLIVELDGALAEVEHLIDKVESIAHDR